MTDTDMTVSNEKVVFQEDSPIQPEFVLKVTEIRNGVVNEDMTRVERSASQYLFELFMPGIVAPTGFILSEAAARRLSAALSEPTDTAANPEPKKFVPEDYRVGGWVRLLDNPQVSSHWIDSDGDLWHFNPDIGWLMYRNGERKYREAWSFIDLDPNVYTVKSHEYLMELMDTVETVSRVYLPEDVEVFEHMDDGARLDFVESQHAVNNNKEKE